MSILHTLYLCPLRMYLPHHTVCHILTVYIHIDALQHIYYTLCFYTTLHIYIQVINFYELRTNQHIKTTLALDSIETLTFLSIQHSSRILQHHRNSNGSHSLSLGALGQVEKGVVEYVLISGGEKGLIHMHAVSIKVCLYLYICIYTVITNIVCLQL